MLKNTGRSLSDVAAASADSRSPDAPRLRVMKASELIARELREAIIRGEIREGTNLPEHELLAQFGVSRPTLREAIRLLEGEHLLELSRGPKGGARVLRPSIDVAARYFGILLQIGGVSLADLYRASALIEPAAVRLLARENPAKAADALRACLAEASAEPGRFTENALTFTRFHTIIVEQTGVQTLILLMSLLHQLLERHLLALAIVFGKNPGMQVKAERQLKLMSGLTDLIEQGDAEGAALLWAQFLEETEMKLRSWEPSMMVIDSLRADQFSSEGLLRAAVPQLGRASTEKK